MSKQTNFYEQLRQTQTNTFSDGMNMDLHPLTTPSTILTDCVNGTMITYNDNEFVLQNARGNSEIEHSELTEGYIPLAMEEHGGIIYIVSRNSEGNVKIGTFPSPGNTISIDKDSTMDSIINEINAKVVKNEDIYMSKINTNLMYYFNNDEYSVCAPDRYKYKSPKLHDFLKLSHYLIDKNGTKEYIELVETQNDEYTTFPNKYEALLAYQLNPVEINDFKIIDTTIVNSFGKSLSYYLQINSDDNKLNKLLQDSSKYKLAIYVDYNLKDKNSNNIKLVDFIAALHNIENLSFNHTNNHFKFYITNTENYNDNILYKTSNLRFNDNISSNTIFSNDSEVKLLKNTLCPEFRLFDGYNSNNIYWNKSEGVLKFYNKEIESFEITFTPVLEQYENNNVVKILYFDKYIDTKTYAIKELVKDPEWFTEFYYHFDGKFSNEYIDNTEVTLVFNIDSYFNNEPYDIEKILNSFDCSFSIWKITNMVLPQSNGEVKNIKYDDNRGIIINAVFNNLEPYNIYIVKFDFNDIKNDEKSEAYFSLIIHEYFNDLNPTLYPRFDKIPFNQWFNVDEEIKINENNIDSLDEILTANNSPYESNNLKLKFNTDISSEVNTYLNNKVDILDFDKYGDSDVQLIMDSECPQYKLTRNYKFNINSELKTNRGFYSTLRTNINYNTNYIYKDEEGKEHNTILSCDEKNISLNELTLNPNISSFTKKYLEISDDSKEKFNKNKIKVITQNVEIVYLYELLNWDNIEGYKKSRNNRTLNLSKVETLNCDNVYANEANWGFFKFTHLDEIIGGVINKLSDLLIFWTVRWNEINETRLNRLQGGLNNGWSVETDFGDVYFIPYRSFFPINIYSNNNLDYLKYPSYIKTPISDIKHGAISILEKLYGKEPNFCCRGKIKLGKQLEYQEHGTSSEFAKIWWLGYDKNKNSVVLLGEDIDTENSNWNNFTENMISIATHSYTFQPIIPKNVISLKYDPNDIKTKMQVVTKIDTLDCNFEILLGQYKLLNDFFGNKLQSNDNFLKEYNPIKKHKFDSQILNDNELKLEESYIEFLKELKWKINNYHYDESDLVLSNQNNEYTFGYKIKSDLTNIGNINENISEVFNLLCNKFIYSTKYANIVQNIDISDENNEYEYFRYQKDAAEISKLPFNITKKFDLFLDSTDIEQLKTLSPKFIKKYGG